MTLTEELSKIIGEGQILENELMKNHTTFRIGGPVDVLVCPETEEAFVRGLGWCKSRKIPVYIIGNGSNLLVGDRGIRGLFLKYAKIWIKLISSKKILKYRFLPEPEPCWQNWQKIFQPEAAEALNLPQGFREL